MNLQSFRVNKLHGTMPDYELRFKDNVLVLVGENGSGKSTMMKLLLYVLSRQWGKLVQFEFDSIEINLGNDGIVKVRKEDLMNNFLSKEKLGFLPNIIRRRLTSREFVDLSEIQMLCKKYGYPYETIFSDVLDFNEGKNKKNDVVKEIQKLDDLFKDYCVLYLPTYRRIEQDLEVVLENRIDENFDEILNERKYTRNSISNSDRYIEMVEFGMNDVKSTVNNKLIQLRRSFGNDLNSLSLKYLSEIVNEEYKNVIKAELDNIEEDVIRGVPDRVEDGILSNNDKNKLVEKILDIRAKKSEEITEDEKVVCHYFMKLYSAHRELVKNEVSIRKFADICSKYLYNKKVVYDGSNFAFNILSQFGDQVIEFSQLSSGEKQIVSLFCKICLEKKKYFILIDEPELSLSVDWQKQFLEDIYQSDCCSGLFAVTHSPFIFDNELDVYAHGINEFKVEKR